MLQGWHRRVFRRPWWQWSFGFERAKLDVGLTRVQECHPSAMVSVKIWSCGAGSRRRRLGADFWDVGRFEGLGELGKAGYGSEYLVKSVVTFCLAGLHIGHCLLHGRHSVFFHRLTGMSQTSVGYQGVRREFLAGNVWIHRSPGRGLRTGL